MKLKSPTDLVGITSKEIVWSDLSKGCRQGGGWGRGVAGISWLSGSQGDRTGGLDLQTVEVPVSISIELADQSGVHLPVVETDIINLPVEVATARIAVTSNDYILSSIGINRGGAGSVRSSAIHIELGCTGVGCRWEANRQMVPVHHLPVRWWSW